MAKEFALQDPGEGIHEAEVVELRISEGDHVEDGDIILVVETDKATTEVPAPFTGTIKSINVSEGDMIEIGEPMLTYEEGSGEQSTADSQEEDSQEEDEAEADDDQQSGEKKQAESKDNKQTESRDEKREKNSKAKSEDDEPAGDEMEAEDDLDEKESKGDLKQKGNGKNRERRDEAEEDERAEESVQTLAAPATRRLAKELNVDIERVEGTGPDGRVTPGDVRSAAADGGKSEGRSRGEYKKTGKDEKKRRGRPGKRPLPDFERWGEVERLEMRSVRRAIARHMTRAWQEIPHVTHQDRADITELERFRHRHESDFVGDKGSLTLTLFVMKAVVAALKEFPELNASVDPDNEEIIRKKYYHLGIATDTDRGLIVPVIRDVDGKSVAELAEELSDKAERARNGDLTNEEVRGGTFTITNPGPMGGTGFTPIINYPEAAILGLGRAELVPVARGDIENYTVEARVMLPLCLAFDHRIIDGATAARFVTHVAETLQSPDQILLTT